MEQEATEITEINSLFPLSTLFSKDTAMHPKFAQASGMTHDVIGAAIEVHKDVLCCLCLLMFKMPKLLFRRP